MELARSMLVHLDSCGWIPIGPIVLEKKEILGANLTLSDELASGRCRLQSTGHYQITLGRSCHHNARRIDPLKPA